MNIIFGWLLPAALLLEILIIIWVYQDANERQANGLLWALAVLAGNLPVLLIYLAIRPKINEDEDPDDRWLDILDRQLAAGEIDNLDYEQLRRNISQQMLARKKK